MTEPTDQRWAVVLSGYRAVPPPGVAADAYAEACLTDSYEVIAGLAEIQAGLAGPTEPLEEIRWPSDRVFDGDGRSTRAVADQLETATELIVVAADVPDLPEMIIAKLAKALACADVALAPELGGAGLAAAGVRLPWPGWLDRDLDLDQDPYEVLAELAPRRNLVVHTPGWHRLRTPQAVHRLDPRLEGWDNLRLLLTAPTG